MRLAGREWRTSVQDVRLGADHHRVIRPARPIAHASLYEGRLGAHLSVDKAAAADLASAWWLAARSPHSLVHLPLRSSTSTCGEEYGPRKLDLVLLHHSLAFPVSRWKEVRAHRSRPAPHKVTLPPAAFPAFDRDAHHRSLHDGFHDHLRWSIAADTLFLVGSRHAYELRADEVRALAEDCSAHLAQAPETHCCAELGLGHWTPGVGERRNPPILLHVQRCNRHR
ncbi:hypothetical protein [Actinosynnema sp. NPDC020468]|uniref:hypothetical protein n=1 Tax=Actinosynnema sp. NPDC020468 TaxID=3154488 RepID=UPI0033D8DD38